MAARLSILATTLVALVLLVATNAFAYRTTITTVEREESSRQAQKQCQQEIQMHDMKHCEQYAMQQRRRGGGNVLAMTTDVETQSESEHLKPCCQELKKVSEQCQCPALAQIVQQRMQQGERLQQVAQKLQNLPQRCQVGSHPCRIQGSIRWF